MKRRTFLKGLGASGALILSGHGIQAVSSTCSQTFPGLTCVVDRLPAIREELAPTWPQDGDERSWEHVYEGFPTYPVIMGFGRRAERIIARYPRCFDVPKDGSLYHTGVSPPLATLAGLAFRLQATATAMLLIDSNDPGAVFQAHAWAKTLATTDVFVRAALLMEQDRHSDTNNVLQGVQCPVIEVINESGYVPDATTAVDALLPGLSDFSGTFPALDPGDVRKILQVGSRAQTQAIAWKWPDMLDAKHTAIRTLGQQPIRSVIGLLNTGMDLKLHEIEDVRETIMDSLDTESLEYSVIFSFVVHPSWTEGRRVLSLTTVQ